MKSKQRQIKRGKKQGQESTCKFDIIYYGNGHIGINVDELLNLINFYTLGLCYFQIVYEDFSFINKNDILNFWYFDIKYLNIFLDIIQDKVMNYDLYSEDKKDRICSIIQKFKINK